MCLFGVKAVKVYACIAVVCVALGSMLEAPLVWNLSDLFNALMVFPNLIALLALSGVVAKMAREDDHDLVTPSVFGTNMRPRRLSRRGRSSFQGQIEGKGAAPPGFGGQLHIATLPGEDAPGEKEP